MKLRQLTAILSITLIAIALVGSFISVYVYSRLFGEENILSTVKVITAGETDPVAVLNSLADWEKNNMIYNTDRYYFYPSFPFFLWRQTGPDAQWIMTIKRGGCEEYATLFAEMARSIGIESRVVYNLAEDHVWTEVLINGSWLHFDSMLTDDQRFNNTGFYERPRDQGGWGKQLSYVFYIDKNGKQQDITSRYTNTGRLSIIVEKDGVPVENARVIVESRFLMENDPNYKESRLVLENNTDKSGQLTLDLGGNDYTIIAESGILFGYRNEVTVSLKENDNVDVKLNLTNFTLLRQ